MEITITVTLGSQKYVLGPRVRSTLQGNTSNRVVPTVVLTVEDERLTSSMICAKVSAFQHRDDVYSREFLTDTLVLQAEKAVAVAGTTAASILRDCGRVLGVNWDAVKVLVLRPSPSEELPDGPYFINGHGIFQAWKVYSDDCDAFQTTVIPNRSGPHDFSILDAVSADGNWKGVAVPSRLYDKPSPERPLAGTRISIKDNIKLSGVATTLESQSFLNTYGTDTETAPYISRLIRLGAVIVGKTKLAAFASAENPPENWIDFRCPRNPRGDRYQQPTGSSTGAGASLAAYEWLDFSVGTDTTGSIRAPAAFCGLFGIRLSTHIAAPFHGIYPNSPCFDTVGLLARDLQTLSYVAESSLNKDIKRYPGFPKSIIYPTDFFAASTPDQEATILEFLHVLEKFLGVTTTKISLAEKWLENSPTEGKCKPLLEFSKRQTVYNINYYDCFHEYDRYRQDHKQKYGHAPYVSPYMKWKWDLGLKVSLCDKEQSVKEMSIFKSWFEKNILQKDKETGSSAIVLLPIAMTKPWYRDSLGGPPKISEPFTAMYLTIMTGMSQVLLPVAQTTYLSEVTKRTEYLPFTTSIAGAAGSDLMLLKLANAALTKAGWPTRVLAGPQSFHIGNNIRKVGLEDEHEKSANDTFVNIDY